MKTRIIYTDFFEDDYILSLTIKERYVFSFLLWNKNVNLCGMYKISDKVICFCCEIGSIELKKIKEKFVKDGKFFFFEDWIKIMNYENYNFYKGEKNKIALNRERASIPEEVIGYTYSISNSLRVGDTPINHKSEISNHKLEIRNNKYSEISEIKDTDLQEIAEHYQVPLSFVKSKLEDMNLWKEQQPGSSKTRGRNWKMTLYNWVKKDAISIRKETYAKSIIAKV